MIRSSVDVMLSELHRAQLGRTLAALRSVIPWTNPEIMCVLTVGTAILGLPVMAFFLSDAGHPLTPLQQATGRVLSITPTPADEHGILGLDVAYEVCGRTFRQPTVAVTHKGLKVGMFFPVTFRVPYAHGEPKNMLADFFFARDTGPVQSDKAVCSQLRTPWW